MLPYFDYPFGRPEELGEGWLHAVYLVSGAQYETVLRKTGNFAVGQSIGTWVKVPGVTPQMVQHRQARVSGLYAVPGPEAGEPLFLLRLSFPMVNFGGSFTNMLTALVGNDVSTAMTVRLLDIELSAPAQEGFGGPKKGMQDLRELAGVQRPRPLVLNMIKPCAGFSAQEGAKLFYQVALGGVDMVKDDELFASPEYCTVAQRTKAYLEAAEAAHQQTGKRTLYLPNISGTPKQVRQNAKAIIQEGAKACLINYVFGGLDMLKELADEFGDELFIMGHYAGVSVFDAQYTGIADNVFVGSLPRLAGAHAVMTMFPNRQTHSEMYNFYRTVQAQTLPIPGLAPVVTTVGGGMTPINQQEIQQDLGSDIVIGIGGAIQGHPHGTTEGTKAAMAAVQATHAGVPLAQAADNCPPLAKALELWAPGQ